VPRRKAGLATIDFVGELTIKSANDLREKLLKSLGSSPEVRANVSSEIVIDLTFVQLIESARRTAREVGCDFRLAAPAAGPLLETLERGGFLAAPGQREFWLMQTEDR
jgi:anti-anti-sigma regulatory factor